MDGQKRMSWRALIFLLFLMLGLFLIAQRLIAQSTKTENQTENDLLITLSGLQGESSALNAEIKLIGTEGYIEMKARRDLGFVSAGELRFEFVNPEALETLTDEEYAALKRELAQ